MTVISGTSGPAKSMLGWFSLDKLYEQATKQARKYSSSIDETIKAKADQKQDTVNLSPRIKEQVEVFHQELDRAMAEAEAKKSTPKPQADKEVELNFSSIWSSSSENGSRVEVEAAKDADGYQAARVTFTDAEGNSRSEILSGSAVLSQSEDGNWQIHYAAGSEADQSLRGSAGDDIIIVLPQSGSDYAEVEAGDGDNVVLDLSNGHTKITTGSGNDKIFGLGGGSYEVASGDGDDEIYLKDGYAKVEAGAGNDKITIDNAFSVDLDGGDGDDAIVINGDKLYMAAVRGGAGDDSITVTSWIADSSFDGGDGNDRITINAPEGRHDQVGKMGGLKISGGAGDDAIAITTDLPVGADIDGGDGQDRIEVKWISKGQIDGGAGDDTIEVGHIGLGTGVGVTIDGGDGHDDIRIGHVYKGAQIYGGNGDDRIHVESTSQYTVDEMGEMSRSSSVSGNSEEENPAPAGEPAPRTIISGGAGNDAISGQNIRSADIDGGEGGNTITIEELIDSTIGGRKDEEKAADGAEAKASTQADTSGTTSSAGRETITIGRAVNSEIYGGGGSDAISVDKLTDSFIDGGEGDDSITVGLAQGSGIAGGAGDDQIEVDEAIESQIAADSLKWERRMASHQYLKFSEPAAGQTVSSSPESQSADPGQREWTEEEIFMDALIRGDTSHPRVKEILEQNAKLNVVA